MHPGERVTRVEARSDEVRAILDLGDNDKAAPLLQSLVADIEALIAELQTAPWPQKARDRVTADLEGHLAWAASALARIKGGRRHTKA